MFVVNDNVHVRWRFRCKHGRRAWGTFYRDALKIEARFLAQLAFSGFERPLAVLYRPCRRRPCPFTFEADTARVTTVQDQELPLRATALPHDDGDSTCASRPLGVSHRLSVTPWPAVATRRPGRPALG